MTSATSLGYQHHNKDLRRADFIAASVHTALVEGNEAHDTRACYYFGNTTEKRFGGGNVTSSWPPVVAEEGVAKGHIAATCAVTRAVARRRALAAQAAHQWASGTR